MGTRTYLALLSIAAVIGPFHVAAQQQQPPPAAPVPTAKGGTEEVVLDVIVRDKKGKPVTDLGPADFDVTDNGAKRELTSVRLITGREAMERGSAVQLDPMKQIRLVTLVFESLGIESRRLARQAAMDLIKGNQAQNVYYSVFVIANRLSAVQQFTDDKDLLKKAIDKATSGLAAATYTTGSEAIKSQLRAEVGPPQPGISVEAQGAESGAKLRAGGDVLKARLVDVMLNILRFDASMTADESTRLSLSALGALARGEQSLPGRKSILYFNEGFTVPEHLEELFQSTISAANTANVSVYPIDVRGLGSGGGSASGRDVSRAGESGGAFSDLAEAATLSREQLGTGRATSTSEIQSQERAEGGMRSNTRTTLDNLANSTGGVAIMNTNDFRGPLRKTNEDINTYYEITYNPHIDNYDGTFRKTAVEVKRSDLKVQARSGYFALPPMEGGAGTLQPFEVPLLKALSAPPFPHDVEFRSASYRFQTAPEGTREVFVVEVPMKDISFAVDETQKTYRARISLLGLVKDANGAVVQKFTRDVPLSGTVDRLNGVKAANFTYKEPFVLTPGRYTLETAVIDRESNKIAARKAAFTVTPKPSGVAMSNLTLVRSYQPNVQGLDPNDPFQFQGGRITPSVSPNIPGGKGSQLAMFFVVYPDPAIAEKPAITIEYIKDGSVLGRGEVPLPAADAQGRIPYVMSSSAEQMPPGAYEIRAIAKQGASTTEERTFITVEAPSAPPGM